VGTVLSLRGVRHRRGGRVVLDVAELSVPEGERLAVLGPNGAGKTTLLRLLAAVESPSEGLIRYDGAAPSSQNLVALRRRIALVTQQPGLLSGTAARNVELPLAWRGVPRAERRARALAALERVAVAHLAQRRAQTLSGGEAQRVNLARALVTEPELLLLDEPSASLDPEARADLLTDVDRATADRVTTVVHVSHRVEEALRLADRVAVLVDGHVRQVGPATDVLRHPADARVARLMGYDNVLGGMVGGDGELTVAGLETGMRPGLPSGPCTVAFWATGLDLTEPADGWPHMVVERVTAGPGRWEVALGGPVRLVAHLPMDAVPPAPGDRVSLRLDPRLVAVAR
jgi:ABC-type Fe3+/spermidine/putrescine transport system ATPase subunit